MNALCRCGLTILVAIAALLAPVQGLAQDKKPAVVVSIASLDKLLADVGYLTRAAGAPEFGGLVQLMIGPYTQGLDAKRPAGVFLQINGPQPSGVAFLPVANLDMVLQQLENNNIEVEDAADGVQKINLQRPIFLKEKDGWAFISDNQANLANLPANPVSLLGGLEKRYNLAVQINPRSIPEELVDLAVSEMKNGFERNLENETDSEKRAIQEKVGRRQLENIARVIRESEQITVGFGVDSQGGKTFLDFGMTAVTGSRLAEQMDAYQKVKSAFAGLQVPTAAASFRLTAPIAAEDIDQAREALKAARDQALKGVKEDDKLKDEDAKEAVTQVVNSMFDVLLATVEAGKIDAGAALILEPEAAKVVAGGFVADGQVVQDQLKKLVKLAEESGDNDVSIEKLKFNAAKHRGVDLHTFSVPIPDDEEQAQDVFGEELDVVVGTSKQSAFLAFGKDSMNLLKGAIDVSAAPPAGEQSPLQVRISLAPILRFAAAMEENPIVEMLADQAEKVAGKDNIRLTQKTIPRGTVVRLEVEEGVLQTIGTAAKAQNQGNN